MTPWKPWDWSAEDDIFVPEAFHIPSDDYQPIAPPTSLVAAWEIVARALGKNGLPEDINQYRIAIRTIQEGESHT